MTTTLRRSLVLLAVLVAASAALLLTRGADRVGADAAPIAQPQQRTPSHGTRVITLLNPERIAVVDRASGRRVAQLRVPSGTLCRGEPHVVGDRIVWVESGRRSGRVMSADLALEERPRRIAAADVVVASATPGELWLATLDRTRPRGGWRMRTLDVATGRTSPVRATTHRLPVDPPDLRFGDLPAGWRQVPGGTRGVAATSWPYVPDAHGPAGTLPPGGVLVTAYALRRTDDAADAGKGCALRLPTRAAGTLEGSPGVPEYRVTAAVSQWWTVEARVAVDRRAGTLAQQRRAAQRVLDALTVDGCADSP